MTLDTRIMHDIYLFIYDRSYLSNQHSNVLHIFVHSVIVQFIILFLSNSRYAVVGNLLYVLVHTHICVAVCTHPPHNRRSEPLNMHTLDIKCIRRYLNLFQRGWVN